MYKILFIFLFIVINVSSVFAVAPPTAAAYNNCLNDRLNKKKIDAISAYFESHIDKCRLGVNIASHGEIFFRDKKWCLKSINLNLILDTLIINKNKSVFGEVNVSQATFLSARCIYSEIIDPGKEDTISELIYNNSRIIHIFKKTKNQMESKNIKNKIFLGNRSTIYLKFNQIIMKIDGNGAPNSYLSLKKNTVKRFLNINKLNLKGGDELSSFNTSFKISEKNKNEEYAKYIICGKNVKSIAAECNAKDGVEMDTSKTPPECVVKDTSCKLPNVKIIIANKPEACEVATKANCTTNGREKTHIWADKAGSKPQDKECRLLLKADCTSGKKLAGGKCIDKTPEENCSENDKACVTKMTEERCLEDDNKKWENETCLDDCDVSQKSVDGEGCQSKTKTECEKSINLSWDSTGGENEDGICELISESDCLRAGHVWEPKNRSTSDNVDTTADTSGDSTDGTCVEAVAAPITIYDQSAITPKDAKPAPIQFLQIRRPGRSFPSSGF